MTRLALRMNLGQKSHYNLPLTVYTVGLEKQLSLTRIGGFSGMQLLFTQCGSGRFRVMGQKKWDIVTPFHVLYIPEGLPHEYHPDGEEPWIVGFVSFKSSTVEGAKSWGFGDNPRLLQIESNDSLFGLLHEIWAVTEVHDEVWASSRYLFSLLIEINKLSYPYLENESHSAMDDASLPYRDSVVQRATRFLQDYVHRDIRIAELANQIGYSQKQLTRLFLQAYGTTPLQYLKKLRMQAAVQLLNAHGDMPIQQIARHIGMEPVYFTRMFRQEYGVVPSQYRNNHTHNK